MNHIINNEYFEWLFDLVCDRELSKTISYRKLLMLLRSIDFTYTIPRDENRAHDGLDLRRRFAIAIHNDPEVAYEIDDPCSVLEMMIALAIRCEETIMDDPKIGDRTVQWFWGMINNLGVGDQTDKRFDKVFVTETIQRFLNREYAPDGRGGLFRVRNFRGDLRDVEIWVQLNWYLDSFIGD